jgi:hypothetical protein
VQRENKQMVTRVSEVPGSEQAAPTDSSLPPTSSDPTPGNGRTEQEEQTARYTQNLEAALASVRQQLDSTTTELERVRTTPVRTTEPEVMSAEEARQKFYNNPIPTIDERLDKQLDKQLAPLKAALEKLTKFATAQVGNQTARNYMNILKLKPEFAAKWNDRVEKAVMDAMDKVSEENTNEMLVMGAIVQAFGMDFLGQYGVPEPTTARRDEQVTTTPAHMRPTPPPGPGGASQTPKNRDLSEAEARLAREKWPSLTKDEQRDRYLAWLGENSGSVTMSTIGKPPVTR